MSEATRLKPDVLVVDVAMPLLNGLDAARRVREQIPNIKIVFLTMKDDPNLAAAALELGRVGFVLKSSAVRGAADSDRSCAAQWVLLSAPG